MPETPQAPRDLARQLAERGLDQQQRGDNASAERTLDQALEADPDTVVELLRRTGGCRAGRARRKSRPSHRRRACRPI